MVAPLLQAKLSVPTLRAELVARPRLFERLDAGLRPGHKLTLLSAPAGYGKTTLVAAWLHTLDTQHAAHSTTWLSLDPGDNEPACFLTYLIAALQRAGDEIGSRLHGLLALPQLPPLESLLAMLLEDLAARPGPFVLVLDDLHEITHPGLLDALGFWVEHQPPHVHTMLITRQDPPLPLARWRVRGQMIELRQRDLSFTLEEAVSFLLCSMGIRLSTEEIATLEERTEGWIAGLQMAALALQGADADAAAEIVAGFTGRHHFVLDYLTDEVLRRQPARVRVFLLRTCILEEISGPLCDALLATNDDPGLSPGWQTGDAQAVLEHLERANLFVVPLDGERTVYRYHHLFGELLRARLHTIHPVLVPGLHLSAADGYERANRLHEAVHHALLGGAFERAAQTIERIVRSQTGWTRIDGANLLGWLRALPSDVLDARPRFQLLAARALYMTGQRVLAEETLDTLEQRLRREPISDQAHAILEQVAADRASYAALLGQVRAAKAWAEPALARLSEGESTARMRAASVLGLACARAGEVKEAGCAFRQAIAAAEQTGIPALSVAYWCNLADTQLAQGRLRQSLESCKEAERADVSGRHTLAGEGAQPTIAMGYVALQRGQVAYERGELDAAQAYARRGLDLLRRGRITLGTETLHALLARTLQARGNSPQASEEIERALQIARGNDVPRLISLISAHQARVWLAQGHLAEAAEWAVAYERMGATEYLREFQELTLARVYMARRRPRQAQSVLGERLPPAEAAGRGATVIEGQALRALCLFALDTQDEALAALAHALRLAEPEGHVRIFVDAGSPMVELLAHARRFLGSNALAAYASQLLAAFGAQGVPESLPVAAHPQVQPLLDPLTDRELDVLGLLARGLTNAEIGRRLMISLPTVKSHTRNLYGKLDVHSRREAVARARELGLLDELSP